MSLKCQKDSYAQTLTSKVVSCVPSKYEDKECYETILEDTVLYPEGGGQPDDRGKIDGVEVIRVERKGATAVHYTTHPIPTDKEVSVEVDWNRRFDHMQHHSGQHLITAITDKLYGYKTTSWKLAIGGDNVCFIVLDTKGMSQSQMDAVEEKCNQCIRDRLPMTPRWLQPGSKELEEVRSRGLPDDFEGMVRVVDIEGIESNMCCGTHVRNLGDIQCIKLLRAEPTKGSTVLYYVAGNRVLGHLGRCADQQKKLTKILQHPPEEHVEAAQRIMTSQTESQRLIRNQSKELGKLMAFKHLHSDPVDPVAVLHKKLPNKDFCNLFASELTQQGIVVFMTFGDKSGQGEFFLAGDDKIVSDVGPRVAALMEGRAGGPKGRYSGKVEKIQKRNEAEKLVREAVEIAASQKIS